MTGASPPVISRLAPTPSGYLHLGNAVNFIVTWALTRAARGKLWLRFDDLDQARCRPEFVEAIFRDLDALGLDWDAGPSGPDELEREWSQRYRVERYRGLLGRIDVASPGLLYGCRCSRAEIEAAAPGSRYPGTCRGLGLPRAGLDPDARDLATRFHPDKPVEFTELRPGGPGGGGWERLAADPAESSGDFVLWRRDGLPAYHLGSLSDDLEFGVTLIVRGEDLRASTAVQQALALAARIEGGPFRRAVFLHHAALNGPDGVKLSKSRQAPGLEGLRGPQREAILAKATAAAAAVLGVHGLDPPRNPVQLRDLVGDLAVAVTGRAPRAYQE
ncbi:MAG: hypothetical protein IT285_05950 [Bdellovibrionales bacterium]|nr:hypothetical protein [Bdellovibrionales bacterium]